MIYLVKEYQSDYAKSSFLFPMKLSFSSRANLILCLFLIGLGHLAGYAYSQPTDTPALAQKAPAAPAKRELTPEELAHRAEVEKLLAAGQVARGEARYGDWEKLLDEARVKARASGDKGTQALVEMDFGAYWTAVYDKPAAIASYIAAVKLFHESGEALQEASAGTEAGLLLTVAGDYQRALQVIQAALAIQERIGNATSKSYSRTLFAMGDVYQTMIQREKALVWFQKALSIQQKTKDYGGEAATLVSTGLCWMQLDELDKSLGFFQKAQAISERIGDKKGQAWAINFIGAYYWQTDAPAKALERFEVMSRLYAEAGDKRGQTLALNNIGAAHLKLGKPETALEYLAKSLVIDRELGDLAPICSALQNLGWINSDLGHLDKAVVYLREYVAITERLRDSMGSMSEAKMAFLDDNNEAYYKLLKALVALGNNEEAFDLVQKIKARALIDLVANGKVDVSRSMTPAEKKKEALLEKQLSDLNLRYLRQGGASDWGQPNGGDLKMRIDAVQSELDQFKNELYARYPDLSRQRVAHIATLSEIKDFLPEDTALLEFVSSPPFDRLSEQACFLFCVTVAAGKTQVKVFSFKKTIQEIDMLSEEFHLFCSSPMFQMQEEAQNLYKLLIAPAEAQLKGKKRLLICPDRALWELPFHALMRPGKAGVASPKYLIDDYEICYAYSANTAHVLSRPSHSHEAATSQKRLLVVANPDFGTKVRKSAPTAAKKPGAAAVKKAAVKPPKGEDIEKPGDLFDGVSPLPGTKWEAGAIQAIYKDAVLFTQAKAQEATVKQQAANFRYLHFATHGYFNDASPMFSGIILARPPAGSKEDGVLTAREIFGLNLSADLVVLSACETGSGDRSSGEGLIGLTWALFASGASTQVVSQWPVADNTTATLMKSFYTHLQAGEPKGAALRSAMRTLKASKFDHPAYWAPFIMLGDWKNTVG